MSAPEPKAWEATDDEVLRIVQIECRIGDATEEMNKVFATVARRRAIEELKALLPEFCSGCKAGLPPVDHPWKVNKPEWFPGLYHNREEVGMIECECPEIHDRIAAIESEEA